MLRMRLRYPATKLSPEVVDDIILTGRLEQRDIEELKFKLSMDAEGKGGVCAPETVGLPHPARRFERYGIVPESPYVHAEIVPHGLGRIPNQLVRDNATDLRGLLDRMPTFDANRDRPTAALSYLDSDRPVTNPPAEMVIACQDQRELEHWLGWCLHERMLKQALSDDSGRGQYIPDAGDKRLFLEEARQMRRDLESTNQITTSEVIDLLSSAGENRISQAADVLAGVSSGQLELPETVAMSWVPWRPTHEAFGASAKMACQTMAPDAAPVKERRNDFKPS